MVVCLLVFKCFVTVWDFICIGWVSSGLADKLAKSVGGADWGGGMFCGAMECGLVLTASIVFVLLMGFVCRDF